MLLIDALCEPPRKLKLTGLDCEIESFVVFGQAKKIVVTEVLEDWIAFLDLARTDKPQVDCTLIDAREPAGTNLGLQGQAVEAGDILPLVKLLVDLLVTAEVTFSINALAFGPWMLI